MLRPLSLLPALVAIVATTWAPSGAPAAAAAAPADPDAPLSVSIETMSPATVPDRGRITVSGQVTNNDDVTWTTINLYPFISTRPLTTRSEIAEAAATAPEVAVGERVVIDQPFFTIDALEPGASAHYTVSVRSRDLREHVAALGGDLVGATGVYWFGVHALGRSENADAQGSTPTADGRARTFLPRLGGSGRQVTTALVVPLRTEIGYAADGSVVDPDTWATSLAPGGELSTVLGLGEAAGSRPLTWLVDPALTDVTARLEAGNPGRSLGATVDPDATEDPDRQLADPSDPEAIPSTTPETALPSAEPTAEPSDGGQAEGEAPVVEEPSPAERAAAQAAAGWRDRLGDALDSADVLALPYGDLDVPAAAEHDPEIYARARQRSGDVLQPWGLTTTPALGGRGYLDPASITMAGDGETLLGSDLMFPELGSSTPTLASIAGRRVLLASSGAASGGPGPDDPRSGVAVRQRILAEAAVRRLVRPREPLVVVLPSGWAPQDADGFFEGLDQSWLDLGTVEDVLERRPTRLEPGLLSYPRAQERRQLSRADFDSAAALSRAGVTLQYLLTRNDTVGQEVADQALTSLSFAHRSDPVATRGANGRARSVLETSLRGVRIDGPRQVTLSSTSGRFSATLENTLDQPVTVRVQAVGDDPISITVAEEDVRLPPTSRRSVLLTATTEQQGVHNVTLQVTDMAGTVIGTSDQLPIRAAQVSDVIWLIIGTGAALLFGAIGLRIARRLRAARRTPAAQPDAEAVRTEPTDQTPAPA